MPQLPLREVRAALRRERSTDRLVSAELIIDEPDGRELIRAGGVWDGYSYITAPPGFDHQPEHFRLQRSQVEAARGLAEWFRAMRRREPGRDVVIILGGKPGSGKTVLLMAFQCLAGLEWPGDFQFCSNLNLDNRGECMAALAIIGRPEWWTESDDPRDPRLEFMNGHRLKWTSARNVKKLRQRGLPIRLVGINEGQDQGEELYAVAQSAPRRYGGAVVITMNPPTTEGGNWTARLWYGIEAGEVRGKAYQMDSADNAAVDQAFIGDAGQAIRIAAPRLAGAHVDGIITTAGPAAYPTFDGRPYNHADPMAGGCVGEPPPEPDLGRPLWEDVTRELTAPLMDSGVGADVVIGCDFQKHPGCIGAASRLYRTPAGLVLYVERMVGAPGQEDDFAQALFDAGYTANGWRGDGTQGPRALLIGDATGDRQNSGHERWKPPSFHAMKNNGGWIIRGPDVHLKRRIPWNPGVLESIDQMFVVLQRREILLGPRCRAPSDGFPSLVDSFRNAQKSYNHKLKLGEVFQHAPDCVRYLAWRFLPRHKPDTTLTAPSLSIFEAVKKKG